MVFHRRLSDSKSPQVSRTLLSILATLINVVWMVSTRLLYLCPSVPVPILWWLYQAQQLQLVSLLLLCYVLFFQFSNKVLVPISLFAFFQFYLVVSRDVKVHYSACPPPFFLLLLGFFVWPRLSDAFVFQNPREVCAFHFPGRILGCAYTIW